MAITKNWLYPATGAVDPTAAQVANQSEVVFSLVTDGAATTFTLNHNLAVSAADLLLQYPIVIIEPQSVHAADNTVQLFISSKTANTVVFTFLAAAGTYILHVLRPHTLIR